jgi:hypothetical protein
MNSQDYLYYIVGFRKRKGITHEMTVEYEKKHDIYRPSKQEAFIFLMEHKLIKEVSITDYRQDSSDWAYNGASDTHFAVQENDTILLINDGQFE